MDLGLCSCDYSSCLIVIVLLYIVSFFFFFFLYVFFIFIFVFFFQAEDGIRDLVRSRGLGDVYKRQDVAGLLLAVASARPCNHFFVVDRRCMYSASKMTMVTKRSCLLYTSDAADERSSVDLGGRRIIKKKNNSY